MPSLKIVTMTNRNLYLKYTPYRVKIPGAWQSYLPGFFIPVWGFLF